MKKIDKQANSKTESETLSRRKFLEHTAGSAALIGAAATVSCSAAQNSNQATGNHASTSTPVQLMGTMTEYPSGTIKIPAYLSRPKKRGAVPGAVLVIHEVFGLNDHIKSIADRIANEGYLALAPDFFVRAPNPPPKDTTDMDALRKAASSIPPEVAIKDMQAALDYMKSLDGVRRHFASIGFCMGGGFSYQIATHTTDLKGAVIFYGRTPVELVPQVSCPLLGSFGALDTGIPPEKLKEFEEALKKAGKQADIKIYPGAKHGFFNNTRPEAYNAEAAADAWQRTLKFFHERLGK
ncbi:MAG TPA: dienelactone hydrolase family protein [Pyrinomonadaceae bacterium]|jgi:carboxymethylenebutenolidase|nr:dienelactone hydrolase family protein [Pyrinomonadaceae bacterium]